MPAPVLDGTDDEGVHDSQQGEGQDEVDAEAKPGQQLEPRAAPVDSHACAALHLKHVTNTWFLKTRGKKHMIKHVT